jgi:hypothetical protein
VAAFTIILKTIQDKKLQIKNAAILTTNCNSFSTLSSLPFLVAFVGLSLRDNN